MIIPKGAGGKCKMESINSRIPKKSKQVGFSNKHCALCKKHGRPHKLHSTHDCRKYNPDGTPIKRNGGAGSARRNRHSDKNRNQREHKGANNAQMICKEVKKAFCKQSQKHRKIARTTQKVTAIPTTVCEAVGWIVRGN
jgi:hypothetical protein